jgi:hypothetical protein
LFFGGYIFTYVRNIRFFKRKKRAFTRSKIPEFLKRRLLRASPLAGGSPKGRPAFKTLFYIIAPFHNKIKSPFIINTKQKIPLRRFFVCGPPKRASLAQIF